MEPQFVSSHSPWDVFPVGRTEVFYTIEDGCGNLIGRSFMITVTCDVCTSDVQICGTCESTINDGCYSCNVGELLNGYRSCTPQIDSLPIQSNQPSPLCNGAGVPNNMSWFAFIAGSENMCITVQPIFCGSEVDWTTGLQSGVYDFCHTDGGQCIGGDLFCSEGLDSISYEISDLIVGHTYYLFVDGCNGAICEYTINLEGAVNYLPDTPSFLTANSDCAQQIINDELFFCPEADITIDPHHLMDSPTFNGIYDSLDIYDPNLNANFTWEMDGVHLGIWNPSIDSVFLPTLNFGQFYPIPGEYTICLLQVESLCDTVRCNNCCIILNIDSLPFNNDFGHFDVCESELEFGWKPPSDSINNTVWKSDPIFSSDITDPDSTLIMRSAEDCGCQFVEQVSISVVMAQFFYEDFDGDGFGNRKNSVFVCDQPPGFVMDSSDCDDLDSLINPIAIEIPDNDIDEDCDGMDLTTSLHELSGDIINIYPNPVTDRLNIIHNSTLHYKLLSSHGQSIMHGYLEQSHIDLGHLNNGLYLLILESSSKETTVVKLIKN